MAGRNFASNKGFTLIELLVAMLILSVALAALYRVYAFDFAVINNSAQVNEAGQVARTELEWAKVFGAPTIPTGTYDGTSGQGTWNGVYDPTANGGKGSWVANGYKYYTITGAQVATETTAGARFSVQLQFIDTEVLVSSSGGYAIDTTSLRSVKAVVRLLPAKTVIFSAATNVVKGGL